MRTSRIAVLMLVIGVMLTLVMTGGIAAQEATPVTANQAATGECAPLLGIGAVESACVTFIHAVSSGAAVDIFVDGEPVVDALNFGEVSGYVAIPAGEHVIEVKLAEAESPTTLVKFDVNLDAGKAVEIALAGEGEDAVPVILPVDLSPLPPGTEGTPLLKTRVRVVHAVADAPAVNVTIIADDIAERVVSGLEFPEASDYLVKTAGNYVVQVEAASVPLPAIDLGTMTFAGDTVYSFYAIGSISSGNLRALPVAVDLNSGQATARATEPAATGAANQTNAATPVVVEPAATPAPMPTGLQAGIYLGSCADSTSAIAWALEGSHDAMVTTWGDGANGRGAINAIPVWYGEGVATDATFDQLLDQEVYSLAVVDLGTGEMVSCGDVGGGVAGADKPWEHAVLRFGMAEMNNSGYQGTAVLVEDRGILTDRVHVVVTLIANAP